MLKPLASAIHNYSDLSYITKKGVKEKCLCGFKIIQLLRKWSLLLMKQCGSLDLRREKERIINSYAYHRRSKCFIFKLFFPRGRKKNVLIWGKADFPGCRLGEEGLTRERIPEMLRTHLPFYICPMWFDASPIPGCGPAKESGGGSEDTFSSSLLFRHAAFGFRFLSVEDGSRAFR